MSRSVRFIIARVVGLALLTGVALFAVRGTTRAWFEKDMQLRAELAVSGARDSLLERIALGDGEGLARLLGEPTRDERIMGAAICDTSPRSPGNVYRWAGRRLVDAARLRQRDRLNVRLPGRGLNLLTGAGRRVG